MLFQGPIGTYSLSDALESELLELARQARPHDEVGQVSFASETIREWYTSGRLADLYRECWEASGITAACRQLSITSPESLMRSMVQVQAQFDNKPWLLKA